MVDLGLSLDPFKSRHRQPHITLRSGGHGKGDKSEPTTGNEMGKMLFRINRTFYALLVFISSFFNFSMIWLVFTLKNSFIE